MQMTTSSCFAQKRSAAHCAHCFWTTLTNGNDDEERSAILITLRVAPTTAAASCTTPSVYITTTTPSPRPTTPAGASPSGAWLLVSILVYQIAINRKIMANIDMENGFNSSKPSGLRPPQTRLPQLSSSTAQGLQEISESQSNTRMGAAPAMATSGTKRGLPPPGTDQNQTQSQSTEGFSPARLSAYRSRLLTSIAFAVMQPEPKRKTLAEKASEFPGATRSQIAAPTPARSFIKGSALKDIAKPTNTKPTRPLSYNSTTSRHTSNSSYASSIGPGSRPPSRSSHTSYSHGRSGSVRSAASRNGRPMTSMGVREEEEQQKPSNNNNAWDVDERLGTFESEFKAMKDIINHSIIGQKTLEEDVAAFRHKATELESLKSDLESKKSEMQSELDKAERRIFMLERELEDEKRARRNDAEDLLRDHRNDIDNRIRDFTREKDDLERESRKRLQALREELAADFARQLSEAHKVAEDLEKLLDEEKQNARARVEESGKDLEVQLVQFEMTKKELERARVIQEDMNAQLLRKEGRIHDLKNQVSAGQTALIHLKGDEQKQLENFRLMADERKAAQDEAEAAKREAQEAKAKLRVEETRRRKLFEQLQTMKGNIRVMCRIRPGRNETECAQIATEVGDYDDHIGKMTLMVPTKNYLQQEVLEPKPYDFERVFIPDEGNKKVFDEISQLVQSALDGQKVCIFCYGQTGSGKTYTMSSGQDSIIPSATSMIYQATEDLKDAGWTYKMTGAFTEVYNEKLFDLLGADGTRNQVELRQDPASKKYYVTSQETALDSPQAVSDMLETAIKNRTVAATKMNRESSRSHSVFTLKLTGTNVDGTVSEGVLNLIDLAGSERVKESQVEGDNFKEATSINKSLSTLSQVMTALADNASHIPYRNSTLTRMLESCLGGSCKTLMFVMISPLRDDIKETVSSLDFATTVSKAKPGQQGALKAIKTGRSGTIKRK
ncbi:drug resistance protein [Apiospora arundinis]